MTTTKFIGVVLFSSISACTISFAAGVELKPGTTLEMRAQETTQVYCQDKDRPKLPYCTLYKSTNWGSLYIVYADKTELERSDSMHSAIEAIKKLRENGICR